MVGMPRTQTLVQLSDELLAQLDSRAAREGRSRSELIRGAVAAYLGADREADIDRRILDGYSRMPAGTGGDEDYGHERAARAMIAAESWADVAP